MHPLGLWVAFKGSAFFPFQLRPACGGEENFDLVGESDFVKLGGFFPDVMGNETAVEVVATAFVFPLHDKIAVA